jgi:transposase
LSLWLYAALKKEGLAVELLETRRVHDAFKAMPVKSDRSDARGIAQLSRGCFRPVHCKSMPTREARALLRDDKCIRRLLVGGALAVIRHSRGRTMAEGGWIHAMLARKPAIVVALALERSPINLYRIRRP